MIRYYKGKIKCRRLTKTSSQKTALYEMLEKGKMSHKRYCIVGEKVVFPVRLGWRNKIVEKTTNFETNDEIEEEEREEINCLNCKKFLMIGICNYSDFCNDYSEFEPKYKEKKGEKTCQK